MNGVIARARNAAITDFAPLYQYERTRYVVDGARVEFDDLGAPHAARARGLRPHGLTLTCSTPAPSVDAVEPLGHIPSHLAGRSNDVVAR